MNNETVKDYSDHINPTFVRLLKVLGFGRVFTRAKDIWVWDSRQRKYLDCLASFGTHSIGHSHPRLIGEIKKFLSSDHLTINHLGPSVKQAELGKKLIETLGTAGKILRMCSFSSSGSEAVESAMKISRLATRKTDFVYCEGGFHGLNLGTLSILGQDRLRKPFEPLLSNCHRIPFNDLAALERVFSSYPVAGFIVEPVQIEAGLRFPHADYLAQAQKICRKNKTLMILDEVQTGLGRTGTMYAFQSENFHPDILVLAKALSGGLVPIGATIFSQAIFKKAFGSLDRFDMNNSTFGGNALSCAAAVKTLEIIEEDGLLENSREMGKRLLDGLKENLKGHPMVRDIRGRGLLVGIELGPTDKGFLNTRFPSVVANLSEKIYGQWLCVRLLEEGILCQPSSQQWNILRLEPPLTIGIREIDRIVLQVTKILSDYDSVGKYMRAVSKRVLSSKKGIIF